MTFHIEHARANTSDGYVHSLAALLYLPLGVTLAPPWRQCNECHLNRCFTRTCVWRTWGRIGHGVQWNKTDAMWRNRGAAPAASTSQEIGRTVPAAEGITYGA
jgi:hypothetical protein